MHLNTAIDDNEFTSIDDIHDAVNYTDDESDYCGHSYNLTNAGKSFSTEFLSVSYLTL